MAISASKSTTTYAPNSSSYGYTLSVSFTETSTSTANNTSTISISASLGASKAAFSVSNAGTLKIYWHDNNTNSDTYINEIIISQCGNTSSSSYGTKSVSGSKVATHRADGTLSGYAKAVWTKDKSNSYVPSSTSVSTANTTLTTIPRATTCPSATLYVGQSNSITISPASTSFNHTATFKIGSRTFTANAAAGSKTLTFNLNDNTIYSLFSTAYVNVTATLVTKNGNTNIGSKTATWKIQCVESRCRPSVTATYADSNPTTVALTGDDQTIVKGFSNAAFTISATSNYSTISKVTVDGANVSDKVNYTVNGINKNSVAIIATDARGFPSTTLTKTFTTFIDYVPLTCSPTFERNTPTDGKVKLSMTGKYFNDSFGDTNNSLTITYQYKESGASDYGTAISLTPTLSGNTYSYESADLGVNFDYTKSYDFKVNVSDAINSFSVVKTVSKGEPMFWCNDEKIVFNSEPYYKQNSLVSGGVVLYENASGSNGNITLSDSAANYQYLEIFYRNNNNFHKSVKIYEPNGKTVSLDFDVGSASAVWVQTGCRAINGNSITITANRGQQINIRANTTQSADETCYITRVVGYNGTVIPSEFEINEPTLLFDDTNIGSLGPITLNDSASNYRYLEILYSWGDAFGMSSMKYDMASPNKINLDQIVYNNSRVYWASNRWAVSGTTLSYSEGEFWSIGTSGSGSRSTTQVIRVYKVLGYK